MAFDFDHCLSRDIWNFKYNLFKHILLAKFAVTVTKSYQESSLQIIILKKYYNIYTVTGQKRPQNKDDTNRWNV